MEFEKTHCRKPSGVCQQQVSQHYIEPPQAKQFYKHNPTQLSYKKLNLESTKETQAYKAPQKASKEPVCYGTVVQNTLKRDHKTPNVYRPSPPIPIPAPRSRVMRTPHDFDPSDMYFPPINNGKKLYKY